MTPTDDPRDVFRQRNLVRIGRALHLPAQPSAERKAAWIAVAGAPRTTGVNSAWGVRGRLGYALASIGLAAALLAAIWLTAGHTKPVTAAVILDRFRAALAQSLTIELSDIDLGSVSVNGKIMLEQGAAAGLEKGFAIVHVAFKSSNPEWCDLHAKLVIGQQPGAAWQYGCGENVPPGTTWDKLLEDAPDRRMPLRDYLKRDRSWHDFWMHPLDGFGQLPERLRLAYGESSVTYEFFPQQRAVIEQLLRFLLPLGAGTTADALIADLSGAGAKINHEDENSTYVLSVSGFQRLGTLDLAEPPIPDASGLLKDYVKEILYDTSKRRVWSTQDYVTPALRESGLWVNGVFPRDMPQGSPEDLLNWLRERALDVRVTETGSDTMRIRVTGYPFDLDYSGIDWQREFVRQARRAAVLEVSYDAKNRAIRQAILKHIGGDAGRIRLTVGAVQLDPAWLQAEYWVAPRE